MMLQEMQVRGIRTMASISHRRRVHRLDLLLQAVLLVVWQPTDHLVHFIHRMISVTSALSLGTVRAIVLIDRLQAVSNRWICDTAVVMYASG
jgi:hypothetical protein